MILIIENTHDTRRMRRFVREVLFICLWQQVVVMALAWQKSYVCLHISSDIQFQGYVWVTVLQLVNCQRVHVYYHSN